MSHMYNRDWQETTAIVVDNTMLSIGRQVLVDQTDPGSASILKFEKSITRYRETTCAARVRLGGEILKTSETHNDFYGYLTSFRDPLEYGITWGRKYRENPTITVEVVLGVDEFYGVPHTPPADEIRFRFSSNRKAYKVIPTDWIDISGPGAEAAALEWAREPDFAARFHKQTGFQFLSGAKSIASHVLWSSAMGMDQNIANMESIFASICPDATIYQDRVEAYRTFLGA